MSWVVRGRDACVRFKHSTRAEYTYFVGVGPYTGAIEVTGELARAKVFSRQSSAKTAAVLTGDMIVLRVETAQRDEVALGAAQ